MSIVVICYNDAERLPVAVRSALTQSHHKLEVIIVDDHSSDGSDTVAARLAREDDRVRVHRHAVNSGGCGEPRNTGVALASGMFLMFLDSDDVLPPQALELLVREAQRSGAEVTAGALERHHVASGRIEHWYHWLYNRTQFYDTLDDKPELVHDTLATNKLYRASLFSREGLKFPRGVLYEDVIFTAELWSVARGIAILPEVVYHWMVYPNEERHTITNQRTQRRNFLDRIAALYKARKVYNSHSRDVQVEADVKALGHHIKLYLDVVSFMDPQIVGDFVKAAAPFVVSAHLEAAERIPVDVRLGLSLIVLERTSELRTYQSARDAGVTPGATVEQSWEFPWAQPAVFPSKSAFAAYTALTRVNSCTVPRVSIIEATTQAGIVTLYGAYARERAGTVEAPDFRLTQYGAGASAASTVVVFMDETAFGWHWKAHLPLLKRTEAARELGAALEFARRIGPEVEAPLAVHAVKGLAFRTRARSRLSALLGDTWTVQQEETGPLYIRLEPSRIGRLARNALNLLRQPR